MQESQADGVGPVREHYLRYPYPPVPLAALPRRGQGASLAYELGAEAAGETRSHDGIRILVAGAGTVEPALVATVHPRAAEVVAVDLSARSLRKLGARLALLRCTRRAAKVRRVCADLLDWRDGGFDYILATHVLQHHPRPFDVFRHLASMLRPGGLLRLVTYPRHSRFWTRAVGRWLKSGGVEESRDLARAARRRIGELPEAHPIRVSFEENPESRTDAGVADAYLHPCENPQRPLDWGIEAARAGLRCVLESQHPLCRSAFLDDLAPSLRDLHRLAKLQILDDLLELSGNPALWFHREAEGEVEVPRWPPAYAPPHEDPGPAGLVLRRGVDPSAIARRLESAPDTPMWLPSDLHVELGAGLDRVRAWIVDHGLHVDDLLAAIRREVGPRCSRRDGRELTGLTLPERGDASLCTLPSPIDGDELAALGRALRRGVVFEGGGVEGIDLAAQLERLQLTVGATTPWIGPLHPA